MTATLAANKAFHVGLVLTAFGFGFRHGIDWDHIAALLVADGLDNVRLPGESSRARRPNAFDQ